MCCRSWKSILPFALAFVLGIMAVSAFRHEAAGKKSVVSVSYGVNYSPAQ